MERGNKQNEILGFLLVMKGLTQWNKWNSLSRNMKKKPYPGLREDFNRLWILHSDAIQVLVLHL